MSWEILNHLWITKERMVALFQIYAKAIWKLMNNGLLQYKSLHNEV